MAIFALFAGCGGGGETTSSAPLTKQEFTKQGNALCDKVLGERDALAAAAFKKFTVEGGLEHHSKATLERLENEEAGKTVAMYKRLVRELGELNPPAHDVKGVNELLSSYEAILDRIGGDAQKLHEAEPLAPDTEAASYGLISCGL